MKQPMPSAQILIGNSAMNFYSGSYPASDHTTGVTGQGLFAHTEDRGHYFICQPSGPLFRFVEFVESENATLAFKQRPGFFSPPQTR